MPVPPYHFEKGIPNKKKVPPHMCSRYTKTSCLRSLTSTGHHFISSDKFKLFNSQNPRNLKLIGNIYIYLIQRNPRLHDMVYGLRTIQERNKIPSEVIHFTLPFKGKKKKKKKKTTNKSIQKGNPCD